MKCERKKHIWLLYGKAGFSDRSKQGLNNRGYKSENIVVLWGVPVVLVLSGVR
jgi:hypothetical protein